MKLQRLRHSGFSACLFALTTQSRDEHRIDGFFYQHDRKAKITLVDEEEDDQEEDEEEE